jgi:hypothetical protein
MTDADVFESRLAEALRAYAAEAPTAMDPAELAQTALARHGLARRSLPFAGRLQLRPAMWVALAALLLLATAIAVASFGALRDRSRLVTEPVGAIPDDLYGVWEATVAASGPRVPAGAYTIDLTGAGVLRGPDGNELEWAGRVAGFESTGAGEGRLVFRADGACGEGRYPVSADAGSIPGGPTPAAPESGATYTPPPTLQRIATGWAFVVTHPVDACADRLAILTAGPWRQPSTTLVAGTTYGSFGFTEPFHFVLPVMDPTVPAPWARQWGKGGLVIGNGYSWLSTFHDDQPVSADVCDPGGPTLPDVPATPAAVGTWLRSSSGLIVSDPVELIVDGRTALRFDVNTDGCPTFISPLAPPQLALGWSLYAIPTSDDTIIWAISSDGGPLPYLRPGADELVRSITFD